MNIVLIELTNDKALGLLQKLEDLHLIRLLKKNLIITEKGKELDGNASILRKKASDYKGILSPDLADKMQTYVRQSRDEWQQRI
ncbi:MAG TPA: hypothetical protein VGS79_22425 [Puia sp.]|nr:hypothetical protein [Puia sp.]